MMFLLYRSLIVFQESCVYRLFAMSVNGKTAYPGK